MFNGLYQADSGGAHVGLWQSLIVNNYFAAGANIRSWRLLAMHFECGGPERHSETKHYQNGQSAGSAGTLNHPKIR